MRLLTVLVLLSFASLPAVAEETAEEVVTKLYSLVTFEAGTTPDWDEVRSLFDNAAVVVLRTGPDEMTVFSLEGFVNDFITFIEQDNVEKTGFSEKIIEMKSMVYGDIAHVLVLFESSIPNSSRPPREGIDSFELIKKDSRWRIVSVTNERPTRENPIPRSLFKGR